MRPASSGTVRGNLLGILGAAVLTLGVTGALYGRVALSADPAPRVPLSVSTARYTPVDSYQRQVSYLGLVKAGEQARLSFEVAGQIAQFVAREGAAVDAGEVIATLDDSQLQARRRAIAADLEQARAELELAQLKSRRQQKLSASGAVSREAFDETRLRARALESRVAATEARLESIELDLADTRLLAPYDGVIAERYTYPGAVVSPGMPVVRLLQTGVREAHIGVVATRSSELVPGEHYTLRLREATFDAVLQAVRADVDPVTRAATAVFTLPADITALDGESITLLLSETVNSTGGWLPVSALLEGRRGMWTVLRIEDSAGEYRTVREVVEVIDTQGDRAYVRGTLAPDSLVVSDGLHRITPGNTVLLAEGS
ncbi:MAG: efflux RND transporter periplasmic adaptor subunit [Halioglobus sp.]|nr:efflux RND transporter periplasmic adaptor subunit [Halioglobus sp.]